LRLKKCIPSCTNLRADNDPKAHEILQRGKNTLPFFEIGNWLQLSRNTKAANKINFFSMHIKVLITKKITSVCLDCRVESHGQVEWIRGFSRPEDRQQHSRAQRPKCVTAASKSRSASCFPLGSQFCQFQAVQIEQMVQASRCRSRYFELPAAGEDCC
jgi:hypothetical protein